MVIGLVLSALSLQPDAVAVATTQYQDCMVNSAARAMNVEPANLRSGSVPMPVLREVIQQCAEARASLVREVGAQVMADRQVPAETRQIEAQNRFGLIELPLILTLVRRQ